MTITLKKTTFFAVLALSLCGSIASSHAQSANDPAKMSFFITSTGSGDGANYGGLEGADAHCNALAKKAGSSKKWAAYLSTSVKFDRSSGSLKVTNGISARDRIGTGPWHNAKGVLIASDIDELHNTEVNIGLKTGLDENGEQVNGRGAKPNKHDILTGSDSAGYFSTAGGDTTCGNWTSNDKGSAIVGHHDRLGPNNARNFTSWNSSHGSRGCSEKALASSGGAGFLYCFATK